MCLMQCYLQLDQLPQKVVATRTEFSTSDCAEQTIPTFKMFHLTNYTLHSLQTVFFSLTNFCTALHVLIISYRNFTKCTRDKETIWIKFYDMNLQMSCKLHKEHRTVFWWKLLPIQHPREEYPLVNHSLPKLTVVLENQK